MSETIELLASDLPGYRVTGFLRAGRHYQVLRALRESDGQPVILKRVTSNTVDARDGARLEREYALGCELDDPGLVRAQALIETATGPMLVFADDGAQSLRMLLDHSPMALSRFFPIAQQLIEVVGRLHDTGVVHKDLNPGNIIVDPDTLLTRLIDFGMAMRLSRETVSDVAPLELEGTLAYIAPEQTGRLNRSIDGRSDLYSLGLTYYRMLSGRRPFESTDPAELLHCQLARLPPPLLELNPDIPPLLSRLVLKMVAKDPEDRYQSALGVAYDLRECARAWAAGSLSGEFTLASHDLPERLSIPERLYGREDALAAMEVVLGNVAAGARGLLRLGGHSGVGKSALVRELARPVAGRRGHFVAGKFDLLNRDRPYSAIIHAFDELLRRLLATSESAHQHWRLTLMEALGANAQVIVDLLPGFERLLGPQPSVAVLGLNEAQIRFNLVFRRFVRALASEQSPLVLFLDDLQWADSASRSLLRSLLSDPEVHHFLIIGAYRDNEVGPGHPLSLLFSQLHEAQPLAPPLVLQGLALSSVAELIADSLRQSPAQVAELAQLVHAKTDGNPFFARQFLHALYRKGLLAVDASRGAWCWQLPRIEAEKITDNVAELVVERLRELPAGALTLVQLAACIGNRIDLRTLALVSEHNAAATAAILEPALRAEVLVPVGDGYKYPGLAEQSGLGEGAVVYRFQHDRVQQTAYGMIPGDQRAGLHRQIGELILRQVGEAELETRLTEVVDHLDQALEGLSATQRLHLIGLNLRAGRKVKMATAFDAALHYLGVASSLLTEGDWVAVPELAFEVHLERAQAAYVSGNFKFSEQVASLLLQRSPGRFDQVRVLELMINLYSTQLMYPKALEVGLRALHLLGERLPAQPGQAAVALALARTKWRLAGKSPTDLLALPVMTDPARIAALRVMLLLGPPAYFASPNLLPMIGLRMLELSARHGNAPQSAYAYALYGLLHCAVLGDMPLGLAWGKAAMEQLERLEANDSRCRVEMMYAGFVLHWNVSLRETLPVFLTGSEHAIDAGDIEHFGYLCYGHVSYLFMSGAPLAKVADLLEHHYAAVVEHKHEKTQRIMYMVRQCVRGWRGIEHPADEPDFDEDANLALWLRQRDATSLAYLYKFRLLRCLMHADYEGVLTNARQMDRWFNGIMGMAYVPFYLFYKALSLIVLARAGTPLQRSGRMLQARWLTMRLRRWARHSPSTLMHRLHLLEAELAASAGRDRDAIASFERAAAAAREQQALPDVALAFQRLGEFFLERGAPASARAHLRRAQAAYREWGARAWAEALQRRHPDLLGQFGVSKPAKDDSVEVGISSSSGLIDVASFMRSARAISEQLTLSDALELLGQAVMLNAAARRGVLLLLRDEQLVVMAEASEDGDTRTMHAQSLATAALPVGLINFVARSQQRVVMAEATRDPTFGDDPYILERRPRSVLCAPLLRNGELTGVVYLEHDLTGDVFSPVRTDTVEMLCAQAAVSAESARLYDELRTMLEQQVDMNMAQARFVPQQFLKILGRQKIVDVRLGDCAHIEGSILFSDIRGFTSLIEKMSAEQGIGFVNAYLSEMEPAILASGGFVDSYIGDAIMAIFDNGADSAVTAAIGMLRNLQHWNARRQAEGDEPIQMGIGLATGDLMLGTVGGQARIKCGVVGDTVNLAARVESLTKQYQLPLLIADNCHRALRNPERYLIREIDWITVVGRDQPLVLYEVFDADGESLRDSKQRSREQFAAGLACYRNGALVEAKKIFMDCQRIAPDDSVVGLYLQRCERGQLGDDGPFDALERVRRK